MEKQIVWMDAPSWTSYRSDTTTSRIWDSVAIAVPKKRLVYPKWKVGVLYGFVGHCCQWTWLKHDYFLLKTMLAACLVVTLVSNLWGLWWNLNFDIPRSLSPGTSISSKLQTERQGDKSTTWGSSKTCDVFAWMLAKKMVEKDVAFSSPILMMDIFLWQYMAL